MAFREVTCKDTGPMYINLSNVERIVPLESGARIEFISGAEVYVEETESVVFEREEQ